MQRIFNDVRNVNVALRANDKFNVSYEQVKLRVSVFTDDANDFAHSTEAECTFGKHTLTGTSPEDVLNRAQVILEAEREQKSDIEAEMVEKIIVAIDEARFSSAIDPNRVAYLSMSVLRYSMRFVNGQPTHYKLWNHEDSAYGQTFAAKDLKHVVGDRRYLMFDYTEATERGILSIVSILNETISQCWGVLRASEKDPQQLSAFQRLNELKPVVDLQALKALLSEMKTEPEPNTDAL